MEQNSGRGIPQKQKAKKGAKYSEIKGTKAFHPRGRVTGGQEANQGVNGRPVVLAQHIVPGNTL